MTSSFIVTPLFCRHGSAERVYRLEFVSNQDYSDNEFYKWKETVVMSAIGLPTRDKVETKLRDLKEALSYRPKEDDITQVCCRSYC